MGHCGSNSYWTAVDPMGMGRCGTHGYWSAVEPMTKEPMAIGPLLNQYRANLSFYNKTNKNKNCFKLILKNI